MPKRDRELRVELGDGEEPSREGEDQSSPPGQWRAQGVVERSGGSGGGMMEVVGGSGTTVVQGRRRGAVEAE